MKLILLFVISNLPLMACSQIVNTKIRCIEGKSIFPDFNEKWGVKKYDTSYTKVYFLGSKCLYELETEHSEYSNGVLLLTEKRKNYICFDKDSTYGYNWDLKSKVKTRVRIDSALNNVWIRANKYYPMLTSNIAILKESNFKKDSGILTEKYLIKSKNDSTDKVVITFSYTNQISDIDLSMSKELDSIKQMKLFYVNTIFLPMPFKEMNTTTEQFETVYSIRESTLFDEKEILYYFNFLSH